MHMCKCLEYTNTNLVLFQILENCGRKTQKPYYNIINNIKFLKNHNQNQSSQFNFCK